MLRFFKPVILLFATFVLSQTTWADCHVPVCDIAATIQDLKTKSADERSAFYSDLYQTNLNSKSR